MRRTLGTFLALAAVAVLGVVGQAGDANAATRAPVVFVHGFGGNAANWTTAESVFVAGGYCSSQLFAFQYDSTQSNKTSAANLQAYIANVLIQTGASQVDIVNHSMGGLVSDWYIKELGGQPHVRHLASLARREPRHHVRVHLHGLRLLRRNDPRLVVHHDRDVR